MVNLSTTEIYGKMLKAGGTLVFFLLSSWGMWVNSNITMLRDHQASLKDELQMINRKMDILLYREGFATPVQPNGRFDARKP